MYRQLINTQYTYVSYMQNKVYVLVHLLTCLLVSAFSQSICFRYYYRRRLHTLPHCRGPVCNFATGLWTMNAPQSRRPRAVSLLARKQRRFNIVFLTFN